jgi:hypothetical protein
MLIIALPVFFKIYVPGGGVKDFCTIMYFLILERICEVANTGKRRFTPALIIGIVPSGFVNLDPLYRGSEPGNQPLQVFSPGSA